MVFVLPLCVRTFDNANRTVAHEFVIVCSTHVHDTLTSVSSKSLG